MSSSSEKIYISGPMTGIEQFNHPAFANQAKRLRSLGFDVVNPAEHGEEVGLEWHQYLRKDIRLLVDCNAIYMLPGWSKSKGARLEHYIAVELGFSVTGAGS
jgi:hypothetical protein